ncbi:hypothetical protein DP113_32385 [Brasilonema octagenarum UFV-E1]|uniref:Uncharacterized protein n=2 Tax=Brasilonema TaxID=383614 RepID=A0A856MR66_9CYAN|nr:hypothetical protein [Brasilonema octagenarum UFV-OR1]QDL11957.1 hypothetical protein DP114_32285 [Brasilonema sennae CENA114]QDL18332.1 hypothetical protein DP113_32385 [Brasilonema octagenarum UFV-E1]
MRKFFTPALDIVYYIYYIQRTSTCFEKIQFSALENALQKIKNVSSYFELCMRKAHAKSERAASGQEIRVVCPQGIL